MEIVPRFDRPYSIMTLCEVFSSDLLECLLNAYGKQHALRSGPRESHNYISSGLRHLYQGPDVTAGESQEWLYVNRGEAWKDADYWANKGILLTRVNVGCGIIDLYSTHLYDGGNFILPASEQHKLEVKKAQLDDFVRFYKHTHDPRNVAIITGDFNLDAYNQAPIGGLSPAKIVGEFVSDTKTEDVWAKQNTTTDKDGKATGTTAEGDMWMMCERVDGDGFCVATECKQAGAAKRIDYLFIEKPTEVHSFNLDVSRLRRRPFGRAGRSREDKLSYMSDHLGLDVTLIASRR